MWKWNVAVVAIVLVGIGVMLHILLGLPDRAEVDILDLTPSAVERMIREEVVPISTELTPDELLLSSATLPLQIQNKLFRASVAATPVTRQQGLSGTTVIAPDVLKLFVFDTNDKWGIWMKDMNYAIDIVWLDMNRTVVHMEENVAPESYPTVFVPDVPSRYVIEGAAGMVKETNLTLGTTLDFAASSSQ